MHTIILSHLLEGRKAEKENREKKSPFPGAECFLKGKTQRERLAVYLTLFGMIRVKCCDLVNSNNFFEDGINPTLVMLA